MFFNIGKLNMDNEFFQMLIKTNQILFIVISPVHLMNQYLIFLAF